MKKVFALLLALCLLTLPALGETVDAVTTASVVDYFGTVMTAEALVASISTYNGFFSVSTVNEDGTPNVGFFIFSAMEHEGKLYLQFGLAENQTRKNMENGSAVMVMYAPLPTEGTYPMVGARLMCEAVPEGELLDTLAGLMPQNGSKLIYEVTEIRPLG